jgi:hypothetical protein
MYTRNKVPKFQTGNAFSAEEVKPIGYQFGDANLFGKQPSIPFGMRALETLDGYAKAASNNFNTGVAKQFSAPVDIFRRFWRKQVSRSV